ncbi:integrase [Orientia tsutsugamushi str. Gilliam]|uniref:Integrase n=1 Tax=Orientia tsutsugamushi str. Gilliam TaxID=1359184 RepID=A0A2U3R395_ORITS|nr:integrase [Orientia tsutsugamushi str. Gilliam]
MVYSTTQLRVKTLYIGLADVVITILKYLKQDTNSEWIFPSPIEVIANTGQMQQYTTHGIKIAKELEYKMNNT